MALSLLTLCRTSCAHLPRRVRGAAGRLQGQHVWAALCGEALHHRGRVRGAGGGEQGGALQACAARVGRWVGVVGGGACVRAGAVPSWDNELLWGPVACRPQVCFLLS